MLLIGSTLKCWRIVGQHGKRSGPAQLRRTAVPQRRVLRKSRNRADAAPSSSPPPPTPVTAHREDQPSGRPIAANPTSAVARHPAERSAADDAGVSRDATVQGIDERALDTDRIGPSGGTTTATRAPADQATPAPIYDWDTPEVAGTKDLAAIVATVPTIVNREEAPVHYNLGITLFMMTHETPHQGSTMRIGARKVRAYVKSDDWEIVKGSRYGEKPRGERLGVKPMDDGVVFTQPIDPETGRLHGDLVEEGHLVRLMQKAGSSGAAPVHVHLVVPPQGFAFDKLDRSGKPARKDPELPAKLAVLNQMLTTKVSEDFNATEVPIASATLPRKELKRP